MRVCIVLVTKAQAFIRPFKVTMRNLALFLPDHAIMLFGQRFDGHSCPGGEDDS